MARADADGPAGSLVVYPGVLRLVEEGGFTPEVQSTVRHGVHLVYYSAPRLWFHRDAWEAVPSADAGLVLRVEPKGDDPFHLVFSQAELRANFEHITKTESWESPRYYHWPSFPYRAVPFTTPPDDRERVLRFAEAG
ncbi:MAG: hypothetical protein O7C98_16845 [Planctomycetota bacterium]|nr:hypothetical protein [Planctomycetota bacterium]